jgi:rhodanese-related sulfurtransferase
MPTNIDRNQVQALLKEGAQLIEVLPAEVYEDEHLPGASNIPLAQLDEQAIAGLQRERPVIVYCHDAQWDLSPRAAWRLENLGFMQVYDYVTGKMDWLASGLPTEGKQAHELRAKDCARRDTPICHLNDRLRDVQHRLQAAGQDACTVVNDAGIVLGHLGRDAFDAAPEMTAAQVMKPGPSTIRPHVPLAEIAEYLRKRGITRILVTTSDGRLVGVLHRRDAEQMLAS